MLRSLPVRPIIAITLVGAVSVFGLSSVQAGSQWERRFIAQPHLQVASGHEGTVGSTGEFQLLVEPAAILSLPASDSQVERLELSVGVDAPRGGRAQFAVQAIDEFGEELSVEYSDALSFDESHIRRTVLSPEGLPDGTYLLAVTLVYVGPEQKILSTTSSIPMEIVDGRVGLLEREQYLLRGMPMARGDEGLATPANVGTSTEGGAP